MSVSADSLTYKHCPQDSKTLRLMLGSYPTGVCIISAIASDGSPRAMVIGSFTSVSLEPPLVGFFPARTSGTWADIAPTGKFCVNVLGSNQNELCHKMAGPILQRFNGVSYHQNKSGFLLLDEAILHVECGLHSMTMAGDHWLVLGSVIHISLGELQEPLLYHRGSYCSIASLQTPSTLDGVKMASTDLGRTNVPSR